MATKFRVTEGGKETVFSVRPKHILKIERESGGLEASIEASYKLAWLASDSDLSFEDWLENVDDIEPIDEDDQDLPTSDG